MAMLFKVSNRRIAQVARKLVRKWSSRRDALLAEGYRKYEIERTRESISRYSTLLKHAEREIDSDQWLTLDELVELGI